MATSDAPYSFEKSNGHSVITLHPDLNKVPWGEIDSIGTALLDRIREGIEADRKSKAFLVNLAELRYIGSALVALVVRLWKAIKEKDGKMAVVNNNEMVLEVLRLSGLEEVWTICESHDAGLKAIGVSARKVIAPPQDSGAAGASQGAVAPAAPAGVIWCLLGLAFLTTAGIGLFLFTADPPLLENQRIAISLLFGGSLLGVIPGTVAVARGMGLNRAVGLSAVLGCLALLATGIAVHPQRDALLSGKPQDQKTPSPDQKKPIKQTPSKSKTSKSKLNESKTTHTAKPRRSKRRNPVEAQKPGESNNG